MRSTRFAVLSALLLACGGADLVASTLDGGPDAAGPADASVAVDGLAPNDAALSSETPAPGDAAASSDAAPPSDAGVDVAPAPPVILASGGGKPTGIAVDQQYMYWAVQEVQQGPNASIRRANLDGSNAVVLATEGVVPAVVSPTDVVLFGDSVYWINTGGSSAGMPAVARCKRTGCNGTPDTLPYVADFMYGSGLAISDAGLYWAGTYGGANGGSVWRIDASDGGASGPLVNGLVVSTGTVAVDDQLVYFSVCSFHDKIGAVPADAGFVAADAGATAYAVLATLGSTTCDSFHPPSFTIDATSIHYSDYAAGVIGAIPKTGFSDGGVPLIIASGIPGPMRVVDDGTNLYWTVQGPNFADAGQPSNYANGSIMTCPKAGCGASGPRVLATGLNEISGYLAVDASYVYFTVTGDQTVRRVAK